MSNTHYSPSTQKPPLRPAILTILLAWGVAGTLDILSAFVTYSLILGKSSPVHILQGIASVVFGKKAFAGGDVMALNGLAFHYIISLVFVLIYFFLFPALSFLKDHKWAAGLLYGLFAWGVMNLLVLPVFGRSFHFHWIPVLREALILSVLFGLPISMIIHRYYSRTSMSASRGQLTA